MTNELWDLFADCHSSADQQKRQASAKTSACTPISIDFTTQTGQFKGSSGHHTTALDHCSCIDFNRRRLPCKHMYRLAMELELMDADFASNLCDVVEPTKKIRKQELSDSIALIETFSEETQLLLKEILCNMNATNPYKCAPRSPEMSTLLSSGILVEKSSPTTQLSFYNFTDLKKRLNALGITCPARSKKELIDWILENAPERIADLCPRSVVVRASENIKPHKIYTYLYRKYECIPAISFGIENNITALQTPLPGDDVTFLLQQYGYYNLE